MTHVDREKNDIGDNNTARSYFSAACSIAALGAGLVAAENQPLPQGRDVFPFHHKLI